MAKEISVIVDAKNKSKATFTSFKRDLKELDRESRTTTTSVSKNFAKIDKAVSSFSNRLSFMDKIAKRTFKGASVAAGLYVASTLRDFSQLEDGISKVNTLYDQNGKSLEQMMKDSLAMFKSIPSDFAKITQGMYDTISAGADPKYAAMVSRKFGKASVAGMTDMPVVTKAAMGTMNAFGKELTDINHILDIQFLTVKRGITEYGELAASLGTGVLKGADSAGVSVEELYGAIAQLTKNAMPASVATTGLNQVFGKLSDNKVLKRFKKLGIDIQDATKNTRPLVDIFKDINAYFEKKGMNQVAQKGFLQEILGGRKDAAVAMQTLISQLKDYESVVKEMQNSDGTMDEAFKDRLNNLNTQMKLMWNNFKAYGVEQILALKPFMDSLTDPLIKKQELESQKMDLEEALEFSKDPHERKMLRLEIEQIETQIKEMDLTPIDQFKEGLDEGVKNLEKINPLLAQFVETVGNLTLSLIGEEGAENREKVGNTVKGIGALYATKKLGDMYLWFRKFMGGGNTKGGALASTLQTMTVNANVVNVYGKMVNGGGGQGMNPATPNPTPSVTPLVTPVPLTGSAMPKGLPTPTAALPGAASATAIGGSSIGLSEAAIANAIDYADIMALEAAATESAAAISAGMPIIALGVMNLAQ